MSEIQASNRIESEIRHFLRQNLEETAAHFLSEDSEAAPEQELQLVLRSVEGDVLAGLLATSRHGMLQLDILWIDDEAPREVYGATLLKQAEKAARNRGDFGMLAHIFSFQGADIFESQGFTRKDVVFDHPSGYDYIWLEKRF